MLEKMTGWEKIAQAKHQQRENAIPAEWKLKPGQVLDDQLDVTTVPSQCGILTDKELEITGTDADVLVQKLIAKKYSSHEVTMAFCKRAAIAQQLTNCLSEIFFEQALSAAKQLDSDYALSGIPAGPLHGLPVSLKDCFLVEGFDAAIGYTAKAHKPAGKDEESEITKIMRGCGAVLFCKTNVPLAMMSGETFNRIYGYTTNPHNRSLSSGGSSGGESSLLALRGSPLGMGTDVGGSVRIPAAFCGLYSIKPSYGRFPTYGCEPGLDGLETVRSTLGPMAKSLAAIEMWCKAVVDSSPWMDADPDCLPIPWRSVTTPRKLCFGLVLDDGIVKPLPPVTRALLETKAALEAEGHRVIEFSIQDPLYTDGLKTALYRSAAAKLLGDTLSKTQEPWPVGYDMLKDMVDECQVQATVSDLWEAQVKRTGYAKRILEHWAATKKETATGREIDALLTPCTPWPASPKHGFIYDNYTSLWNVLDYCGTTLPVTYVSPVKDVKPDYQARSEIEAQVWEGYSSEESAGCPVAVQIVGRRLNEEYLLGMTRVCDDALKAHHGLL